MTDTQAMAALEVTQADRDAAADMILWRGLGRDLADPIRRGENDGHYHVQAFARHRIASSPAAEPELTGREYYDECQALLTKHNVRPTLSETMQGPATIHYVGIVNAMLEFANLHRTAAPVQPPAVDAEGLACPFCSGFSVVRQDDDPGYPFYVTFEHTAECPMYAVPTDLFKSYRTEAEAIAAWTSRPSITTSPVNSGNILVGGQEYVPLEAYREAMAGWKAANALAPVAGDAEGMREAMEMAQEVRDLLLERIQGSPARSAAHNARVRADSLIMLLSSMLPATPPSVPAQQGEEERREDAHELANAIVIAWEKSPHDFPITYPNQLQMALIAARFLVDLATPPSQDQKGVEN